MRRICTIQMLAGRELVRFRTCWRDQTFLASLKAHHTLEATKMVTLFASLRLLVAIALVAAVSDPGNAQDGYPNRSIKIVTPFAAGGIVDVIVRLVGEQLQIKWHQAVIVESRPGASGNLGAEAVARADPDGYTLLAAPPPPLAINQKLFRRLSFDPSALVPITILAT